MTVESLRLRLLLVAPLRLVLSAALLVAANVVAAGSRAALLVFVGGAFGVAFLAWTDPRARFLPASGEPAALPADASVAPAWLHAVHASFPSTVGVSILAAVALAVQPTLTALLAGVLAGLGIAALVAAYGIDPRLYLEPRTRALFRR